MTEVDSSGGAGARGTFLRTVFMCFDWRVLAGFGVLDLGLLAASPQLALDALPVEILLLCPITAAMMVRRTNAERRVRAAVSDEDSPTATVRPAP
ncbi:MAG TPA: hypothetical protein VGU71_18735 [Candidatus Dormibacteraeota bacterium]|nr:hypothetical protein [Candidatus Dormibacteraeota bacterium]